MLPTAFLLEKLNTQLTICDVGIRQDAEGRFSLNDLHRAAGGEAKHRTNYWINLAETHALISEIEKAGIPAVSTKPGRNGGTYVCKELVYAYAMWISPAFHLKVIRAYDATVRAPKFHIPQTMSEALRLAADRSGRVTLQSNHVEVRTLLQGQ